MTEIFDEFAERPEKEQDVTQEVVDMDGLLSEFDVETNPESHRSFAKVNTAKHLRLYAKATQGLAEAQHECAIAQNAVYDTEDIIAGMNVSLKHGTFKRKLHIRCYQLIPKAQRRLDEHRHTLCAKEVAIMRYQSTIEKLESRMDRLCIDYSHLKNNE